MIIFINGCYRFYSIYADSQTYTSITYNTTYNFMTYNNKDYYTRLSDDVRAVIIYYNNYYNLYFVCDSLFQYKYGYRDVGVVPDWNNNYSNNAYSYTYNNVTYYYISNSSIGAPNITDGSVFNDNLIIVNYDDFDVDSVPNLAYRLTYGDLAVDSTPTINYGDLDIHYSTNIAGSGNAINQNQDVLTWSNISSTGEDLSSGVLELRLVPGIYSASDKSTLLTQLYSDFVVDYTNIYYLDSIPISNGSYAMTWEQIYKHLDENASATNPLFNYLAIQYTGEYWQKVGWIWQYRVYIDDEYLDEEYTTIYTATSSGVSNSEKIINATTYNYDLQTTINNINNVNNDTTNNYWYYQTINVPNTTPSSSDNSWLSTLIQVIGDLVNKILDLLGNAFDTIFNGIIDLIKSLGIDLLGVFTTIFNNIIDFFDNLDLTSSNYLLPSSWTTDINSFSSILDNFFNVWFSNGIGFMIMIPLLLVVVGLFV